MKVGNQKPFVMTRQVAPSGGRWVRGAASLESVAAASPPTVTEPDELPVAECWRLVTEGRELSPAQAGELELRLQRDPRDLASRLRLLGRPQGDALTPAAFALLAGLIEHHPGSLIAGRISLMLPAFDSRSQQVLELWQRQIAAHPGKVRVLGNAAIWLQHYSWFRPEYNEACKALFTRVCTLEPTNPEWLDHLGLVCFFEAGGLGRDPEMARKRRRRLRASAVKDAVQILAVARRLREQQGLDGHGGLSENHYIQIAELACWRASQASG
jgi:hypothetical protein